MNFTQASYQAIKSAYNKAESSGHSSFIFKDQEILTAYAKYLIEHLSTKFPSKP
jgi:hypothetical protein